MVLPDTHQHPESNLKRADIVRGRHATSSIAGWSAWQIVALGVAVIVIGMGLSTVLRLVIRPLALLFAAIIIAETLSPLITRMAQRVPRTLAVLVPYAALLAVIVGGSWLVYPTLASEADQFVAQAPDLVNQFQAWLEDIDPTGDGRMTDIVTSRLQQGTGALVNVPFTIISSVVEVVLVVAMSVYWLIAKPSMHRLVLSMVPATRRDHADDVMGALGATIGGYVRAQVLAGLVIGALTYVGLWLIGVEYALVLAVIAGFGEVIPIVGPILSAIPAIAVALLDSPTQALMVAAFFIGLQQLESNVLQPNLVKNQADIPPLLVLFSLFVGGTIGGILGALVAVPLAGAIKVLVLRVIVPAIRQWSGADQLTGSASMEDAT